jgi:hypothetical protein
MVNRNMLLSITVIAILTLSATGAWAGEDTNDGGGTYTLNAGEYELSTDENGFDILQMEGFPLAVLPGNPMLPHKNYDILVPADAIESSIELKTSWVGTIRSSQHPGCFPGLRIGKTIRR